MKSIALTLWLACAATLLTAQATPDTTIYNIADEPPYPLVASCTPEGHPGWNMDSIRRCAETQLLAILAKNVRYPEAARTQNLQGTVAISFIVEPANGRMTNYKILKDIGGGCGPEALRVLKALDTIGLRWQAGLLKGNPVRVRQTVPIRFRLQEALPYYISEEGDTIYTVLDKNPAFKAGMDSLVNYLVNRLEYPAAWQDSCKTGIIEMAFIIRHDGALKVENQLDFNNLGLDFQFEAMRLARRTVGMWSPAEHDGKPVTATLPLRMLFKSDAPGCATANAAFDRAMILADEGATLLEQQKPEAAIQKWNEALTLQPNNAELLYYRGTALMNLNRRDDACKDYNRVKELLGGVTWFEGVRRLICGF